MTSDSKAPERADMAVEVKPLEWVDYGDGTFRACVHGYDYEVGYEDELALFSWYERTTDSYRELLEDISSAKADAQADYERRIQSKIIAHSIAEIEAAAFRRGAEQMRERAANEALLENERRLALASIRIPAMADEIAQSIRALPLTEEEKA